MAAPLVALLPAFLSALWAGLVVCFRWLIEHAHIAKIVLVCLLIIAAFRVGLFAHGWVMDSVTDYLMHIEEIAPTSSPSPVVSFLAKANYCLPISEMFALLSVYISFCGFCLGIKFLIASYKAIPFKSA